MIFENSRYTRTYIYDNKGALSFSNRTRLNPSFQNSSIHLFKQGDTLDLLAREYLGNSKLWWVILDCNPKYRAEFEIPLGTELIIPHREEVYKCL